MTVNLNPGLGPDGQTARDQIRRTARRNLQRDRARGAHRGTLIEAFRDDIRAHSRGQQAR